MSIAFLVTSLIVVATPGTGVLYTLSAGLSRGGRASVVAAFGCTLGIIPHIIATVTGLAALMNTSAHAFQILKYLGVGYLGYMAWKTFTDKSELTTTEDDCQRSARKVIASGILVNVLNPKLTIFFLAFLPQFINMDTGNATLRMVELSAVFMLITLAVFVGYGLGAAAIRNHVIARPRVVIWMRRTFAAGFVALGAKLAVAER